MKTLSPKLLWIAVLSFTIAFLYKRRDHATTSSTSNPTNYLMDQTYYVESYNNVRGTPNWVSWHITSSDLGSAARQDDFRVNTSLPSGMVPGRRYQLFRQWF